MKSSVGLLGQVHMMETHQGQDDVYLHACCTVKKKKKFVTKKKRFLSNVKHWLFAPLAMNQQISSIFARLQLNLANSNQISSCLKNRLSSPNSLLYHYLFLRRVEEQCKRTSPL